MARLGLLILTLFGIVLPLTASANDFPAWDVQATCTPREGQRPRSKFSIAMCVARENAARSAVQQKWDALPPQIQEHCSQQSASSFSPFDALSSCVAIDLIELKAQRGQCTPTCSPDPELDALFPAKSEVDVAPFPHWDIAAGCEAALKKIGLAASVNACVADETAAQVRTARLWTSLEGMIRFECLETTTPFRSYDLLSDCAKVQVNAAKR